MTGDQPERAAVDVEVTADHSVKARVVLRRLRHVLPTERWSTSEKEATVSVVAYAFSELEAALAAERARADKAEADASILAAAALDVSLQGQALEAALRSDFENMSGFYRHEKARAEAAEKALREIAKHPHLVGVALADIARAALAGPDGKEGR